MQASGLGIVSRRVDNVPHPEVRARGRRIGFDGCADAVPTVLVPALRVLVAHRGIALPRHIDLLKLRHHGSRANTTTELMDTVRAADTIVVSAQ